MKKRKMRFALWLAVLAALLCMGCGGYYGENAVYDMPAPETEVYSGAAQTEAPATEKPVTEVTETEEPETEVSEAETSKVEDPEPEVPEVEASETEAPEPEAVLDPDGAYTSRDDVALYLETYGKLPGNFITKKEAQALGWEGGSLQPYAPGKCIGGDKFGNYEGLLPEADGRVYYECDINTLGAKSRGAKRIVYSNDGLIYYTKDHYQSFTLLYD